MSGHFEAAVDLGVGPALIPATAVNASGGTALNCHAMAGTMRPDTMTHRL